MCRPVLEFAVWRTHIRILVHISRRTASVALSIMLAIVLIFFGLTRTQVGRDGLRAQLVRSFDAAFDGHLEIDRLSGNLVNDLFASGVRLYDANGSLVLSADSVVAEPSWRDLFRRSVSLGSLTLYRPELFLVRHEDGRWNLADALRREAGTSTRPSADPWSFTTVRLQVIDGAIESRNSGPAPDLVARGHLFDYSNASAANVNLRGTIDWRAPTRVVDVQSASASLSTLDLSLAQLQGQLVYEPGNLQVPLMELDLGASTAVLSATVSGMEAIGSGDLSGGAVSLSITDAVLDNAEVQRIFPSYPLRDNMEVTVHAHGPLAALVIEEVNLARGSSRVHLEGVVEGLPESANFQLATRGLNVDEEDLRAVAPSLDLEPYAHLSPVRITADADGSLSLAADSDRRLLRADVSFDGSTAAGRVDGNLSLRNGRVFPYAYDARLRMEDVDPAMLTRDPSLSGRLRGRIRATGEGRSLSEHVTELTVALAPSTLAGRAVDSLRAVATVEGHSFAGTVRARSGPSAVAGRVRATLGTLSSYELELDARSLDAGLVLALDSVRTDIDGRLHLTGSGRTWDTFRGSLDLRIDSSRVRVGTEARSVPPLRTMVSIADASGGGTRVDVSGDVMSATLIGSTNPKVMVRTATLWSRLLAMAAYRDVLKPYPRAAEFMEADDSQLGLEFERELSEERLRLIALARPSGGVGFEGSFAVHNAAAISALFPELPQLGTDLHGSFSLTSDAETLRGRVQLDADSLRIGAARLDRLSAESAVAGRIGTRDEDDVSLSARVSAGSVRLGERRYTDAALDLSLENGSGSMLVSAGDALSESLEFVAALRARGDRTSLSIDRLRYASGDYVWFNEQRDVIDLYAGAAVFHDVDLINEDRSRGLVQQIRLAGHFSAVPGDTLVLHAENIALHQLTDATGAPAVGGNVGGRIALTGGARRPELTGRLDVQHLHFDNRLLGDLSVRSRYVPGSPDVQLDAVIAPTSGDPPSHTPDGLRLFLVEENNLRLQGRFRMPTFDDRRRMVDPGGLDLTLDASRADAFFFEYIFPELSRVSGSIAAQGRITGTLGDPTFEADVRLTDAEFGVPDYNLSFTADADGYVDRDGIHITRSSVRDKTGGAGAITGSVLFNEYRFFSLDLRGSLDELQIMDVTDARSGLAFYGRIWASGNARLFGPLSGAMLQSADVTTSSRSEIYIPLVEYATVSDPGFILFADSAGNVPDLSTITRRDNVLATRPVGERPFVDALEMDLNIFASPGTSVRLVIDPLLGDVMNAVGSGRVQLVRSEGEYYVYGTLDVSAGDYLFTAGDVFMRRFLIDDGIIRWDGDPTDAQLDVHASYRTRASSAGLPGLAADARSAPLIPLNVKLHITGRVSTPAVDLSLALERREQDVVGQGLEAILNDPERSTQYATSVLLTNSFLLTTDQFTDGDATRAGTRGQFAFNSVSQLVASQINRYLSHALPNVDVNFGLQGERAQDLDVTYGVALRLMDERLVIRGEGVYQNDRQNPTRGEFLVQVRLTPSVSVEMFYRREGDILSDQTLTNTTGAGISYETRFANWDRLVQRIFGRSREPVPVPVDEDAVENEPVVLGTDEL